MNLFGETGLQATVPRLVLRGYSNRRLESITGFLKSGGGEWFAHSKKHVIIVKFKQFTLYAGKGESEYEASNDMRVVGGYVGLSPPQTEQIIDFFNWKVEEEQILEFDY